MNAINVQKYIQYCMGFGYLDKKRFANDLAHQRTDNRMVQLQLDTLIKALQEMSDKPRLSQQDQAQQQPPNPFQKALQMILAPFQPLLKTGIQVFQVVALPIQTALNGVTAARSTLEQAMSKVLSFFFGHKKEKTEEKELREKDDFSETDLFTKFVTHASQGGAQGGKR